MIIIVIYPTKTRIYKCFHQHHFTYILTQLLLPALKMKLSIQQAHGKL